MKSYWVLSRRKPTISVRLPGKPLPRADARQAPAIASQLPPRPTRSLAEPGPPGSIADATG